MKTYKLFTYGILKNEGKMILKDCEIDATMFDLGPFPAIVGLNTGKKAVGNVIEVTEDDIVNFDIIEGTPTLYKREIVNTPVGKAFIYIYQSQVNDLEPVEIWGKAS